MKRFCIGDIHGGYKAMLQVLKEAKFNYQNDLLICLGDVADGWPETPECFDELLKVKHLIYVIGNHDCLDTETELFTNDGWKKYNEIVSTDNVIGMNFNGLAEWQPIEKVILKQANELYEMDNSRISMNITKNHRILHNTIGGYKYNSLFSYDPSNSRWRVPLASASNIFKDYNISDELLRILAWVLTDGSITNKEQIILYQSKISNLKRIKCLLHLLHIPFKQYSRQKSVKEICGRILKKQPLRSYSLVLDNKISKELINKFSLEKDSIPKWMFTISYKQARLFIEEILLGDGTSYTSSNCHILYGTEKFLNNIQALCSINGIVANLTKDTRNTFRLNLNETLTTSLRGKFIKHEGDFTVWCLSVPLTNFMVRRHGKVYFTGNSWLLRWFKYGDRPLIWTSQGGDATIAAYIRRFKEEGNSFSKFHEDLLQGSPFYYVTEDNKLFVHGGFNWHKPIEKQENHLLMWDRHLFESAQMWEKYNKVHKTLKPAKVELYNEVFIGHTSTCYSNPDMKPVHISNVWDLDQGGGWEGVLTLMNIDTKEYFQSDLVFNLYPTEKGRR